MENLLTPPDLYDAKRILAVQPHYDDNDIAAGGTLAALSQSGIDVFYLTVTDDLVGVIDQSLSDESMKARLRGDQERAAQAIGVKGHYWLGYPDAGKYDYYDVRRDIIQHIRQLKPDFVFTCDPWLPYEAHRDHIQTGLATAEAAILYNLTRLKTDPVVDESYAPYELEGIVFYATAHPNQIFDISDTLAKKNNALDAYTAQFSETELTELKAILTYKSEEYAADQPFSYGEPLKVLRPSFLHVFPEAWKM